MMPLTLAITTYNRPLMTCNVFKNVIDHPAIDEILILDDSSPRDAQAALAFEVAKFNSEKIRLTRQQKNVGMMTNKAHAVSRSKNDWVILFDSDNVLTKEYLDALPGMPDENTIYCPSFARPNFDMRIFEGKTLDKITMKPYLDLPEFSWFLNTCNYLVHRDTYWKMFRPNVNMRGTDTAWFALNWLISGRNFYVMRGAHYDHLVHDGSEFMKHANYNMEMAQSILDQIKAL